MPPDGDGECLPADDRPTAAGAVDSWRASGVAVNTSREWSWSGSSRTWYSSLRVADQWMAEALGVGVVEGHVAVRPKSCATRCSARAVLALCCGRRLPPLQRPLLGSAGPCRCIRGRRGLLRADRSGDAVGEPPVDGAAGHAGVLRLVAQQSAGEVCLHHVSPALPMTWAGVSASRSRILLAGSSGCSRCVNRSLSPVRRDPGVVSLGRDPTQWSARSGGRKFRQHPRLRISTRRVVQPPYLGNHFVRSQVRDDLVRTTS